MGEVGLENKEREQTNIFQHYSGEIPTPQWRKFNRAVEKNQTTFYSVFFFFKRVHYLFDHFLSFHSAGPDTRFIGSDVFSNFYPPKILAIFLSKKVRS